MNIKAEHCCENYVSTKNYFVSECGGARKIEIKSSPHRFRSPTGDRLWNWSRNYESRNWKYRYERAPRSRQLFMFVRRIQISVESQFLPPPVCINGMKWNFWMGTKSFRNRNEFCPRKAFTTTQFVEHRMSITHLHIWAHFGRVIAHVPRNPLRRLTMAITQRHEIKVRYHCFARKPTVAIEKLLSVRMGEHRENAREKRKNFLITTIPERRGKTVYLKTYCDNYMIKCTIGEWDAIKCVAQIKWRPAAANKSLFPLFRRKSGFVQITSFQITIIC